MQPTGQVLVLHHERCLLLHLRCAQGEPRLVHLEQLTRAEARILVPLLLAFPAYASYAQVLATIANSTMEVWRYQLNTVWRQGEVAQASFLQPIRTVVGGLRVKRHPYSIDIVAVQHTGYLLKQEKGI